MKTRRGDLPRLADEGAFGVIAHGCNCFCTMGAGIAKSVAARFPQALEADRQTPKGERAKLGTCSFAEIETPRGRLTVVNAYTQFTTAAAVTRRTTKSLDYAFAIPNQYLHNYLEIRHLH